MLSNRKDGLLTQDGRFRWSAAWEVWIPTGREIQHEAREPVEFGPPRPPRHSESCVCNACMTAGQHYADYLKAKADPWR